jgi:uncharacterized membrane protein (DUF373 family)
MPSFDAVRTAWKSHVSYERFESVVSRVIMLLVGVVIVYAIILVGIELIADFQLGAEFMEKELLQDIFGSILTVLILLEFNHSIAVAQRRKSGIIQTRVVVLLAILVVARKIILLDFKAATIEQLAGIGGMALALGALYWLIGAAGRAADPAASEDTPHPDGTARKAP